MQVVCFLDCSCGFKTHLCKSKRKRSLGMWKYTNIGGIFISRNQGLIQESKSGGGSQPLSLPKALTSLVRNVRRELCKPQSEGGVKP